MHVVGYLDYDNIGCLSCKIFRVWLYKIPDVVESISTYVFTLKDGAISIKAK